MVGKFVSGTKKFRCAVRQRHIAKFSLDSHLFVFHSPTKLTLQMDVSAAAELNKSATVLSRKFRICASTNELSDTYEHVKSVWSPSHVLIYRLMVRLPRTVRFV